MTLPKRIHAYSPFFTLFAAFSAFLLIVPSPSQAALDRAKEAGFIPHKATYEVQLATKKSSAQVVNISGEMVYEWQPSCDAWITNHRFDLLYEYADTPAVRIASDFSTYESFDGKIFNFTSQRKTNGQVFEELRGSAGADDKSREAVYTIPEDLVFDLPEGSLFPMQHTLDVMQKIRDNKKFFNATLFDGSDKEGPVEVNSFLGKPAIIPEKLKKVKGVDPALINSKAWNLRLAFFPLNKPEEAADYEMDIVFHENGLISDMMVDYGNFSVHQALTSVEPVTGGCEPGAKKQPSLAPKPDIQEQ